MKPATAGFFYFAIVFAAGFLLGAIRIGILAPRIGDMLATLVELPIILGVSWAACLFVVARLKVEARASDRLLMGAVAFGLLIGAEIALGLGLTGRSLNAQIEAMTAPPALVGLCGQIVFALFPLIALAVRR
jgi:hypothetical protein